MAMPFAFTVSNDNLPLVLPHDGYLTVVNQDYANRSVLELTEVETSVASGLASLVGQTVGTWEFRRIAALSGGTVLPFKKHDSTSSSLPAQVIARLNPSNNPSAGDLLRIIGDTTTYNRTRSGMASTLYSRYPGRSGGNAGVLLVHSATGIIEPIVLREGEGLALYQASFSQPHSVWFSIHVRVLSTGKSYTLETDMGASPGAFGQPLLGVFNGSGSGVVLQITKVGLPPAGEDSQPTLRILKTDAFLRGGSEIAPMLHDTRNVMPSTIKAYVAPFYAGLLGTSQGAPYTWPYAPAANDITREQAYGRLRQRFMILPWQNAGLSSTFGDPSNGCAFKRKQGGGPKAYPGEGFAIVAGREGVIETSSLSYFSIRMQFILSSSMTYTRPEASYVS
jgi:hypothetical protein